MGTPSPIPYSLTILENDSLTRDCRLLKLQSREISENAKPGQFIMIHVGSESDHLPPRPFSFCQITPEKQTITIVYKLGGQGTRWLSTQKKGDKLAVLGPLGRPFTVPSQANNIALVAGGIGVTPLISLGEHLKKKNKEISFFLGLRDKASMTISEALLSFVPNDRRFFCTDDGTLGVKGRVTVLLSNFLKKNQVDYIASCGPKPMLSALAVVSKELRVPTEAAIEAPMPCGIGECGECVAWIHDRGTKKLILACKDGPVISIDKLIFG